MPFKTRSRVSRLVNHFQSTPHIVAAHSRVQRLEDFSDDLPPILSIRKNDQSDSFRRYEHGQRFHSPIGAVVVQNLYSIHGFDFPSQAYPGGYRAVSRFASCRAQFCRAVRALPDPASWSSAVRQFPSSKHHRASRSPQISHSPQSWSAAGLRHSKSSRHL